MRRVFYVFAVVFGVILIYSCNNIVISNEGSRVIAVNRIIQQDDGTISLKLDRAECYSDMVNPSSNTAEWNVVVSKSGRYEVWLSSATKDTTDLQYKNSVMLSILDNRIEARPACDKIFQNSTDVTYPYFRADSFIGSLFIQDTGLYNIQIISEKIIPYESKNSGFSISESTKFLSVFLTPITN